MAQNVYSSKTACCEQYLPADGYQHCVENSMPTPTDEQPSETETGATDGGSAEESTSDGGEGESVSVSRSDSTVAASYSESTVAVKPVFWYPAWAESLSSGENQYCMFNDEAPSHMNKSGKLVFLSL